MASIQNIEMFEQKVLEVSNHALDEMVKSGSPCARGALEELSGRALGGNPDARSLIKEIDRNFASGELILPAQREEPVVRVGLADGVRQFFSRSVTVKRLLPPDRDP